MHIRPFRLSDHQAVSHLLSTVLSEECCHETMEALARQLSLDSELVLVAVDDQQRACGVIIGTVDHHYGFYYRLAVDWPYQGKGYGKALITALGERFMKRNVRKIWVAADEHNRPVLPLYESFGYYPWDKPVQMLKIVNG